MPTYACEKEAGDPQENDVSIVVWVLPSTRMHFKSPVLRVPNGRCRPTASTPTIQRNTVLMPLDHTSLAELETEK